MSKLLTICLLLGILLLVCFISSNQVVARSIAIKNRKDGDLTVVIDFVKKTATVQKPNNKKEADIPEIDDTTKEIVSQVKTVIDSKQEEKFAEDLLTMANEVRQVEKLIPGSNSEQSELKNELLAVVNELVKESEKPSALIMESSLGMIAAQKKKQEETEGSESDSEDQAKALWIQAGIGALNFAMNALDGVGTYSTKLSNVGKFISGKAADKLDKWGLKPLANAARNAGNGLDKVSQKIAPFEQKIAKKIAPVVKSKTFQGVKRVVNVVAGAISIKKGLTTLGFKAAKLPGTFKNLKKSLTKATSVIKGRGTKLLQRVTKSGAKLNKASKNSKSISKLRKAGKKLPKKKGSGGGSKVGSRRSKGGSSRKKGSQKKGSQKRGNNKRGNNKRGNRNNRKGTPRRNQRKSNNNRNNRRQTQRRNQQTRRRSNNNQKPSLLKKGMAVYSIYSGFGNIKKGLTGGQKKSSQKQTPQKKTKSSSGSTRNNSRGNSSRRSSTPRRK